MTTKNNLKANVLLEKFLAGKCTPEELELLDNWYDGIGDESNNGLSPETTAYYREMFLSNFHSKFPANIVWWKRRPLQWAAAACMLLLAGGGYLWRYQQHKTAARASVLATFVVTNENSTPKLVVLPDSSHVWLNTTTSLRWQGDFDQKIRSVQLTGEGFFEVNGKAGKPFIIHTRDMAIRVLGTQFNVEAYAGEGITRVSLIQGKVKVQTRKEGKVTAVLQPGYAASYYNGEQGIDISEVPTDNMMAWKEGAFSATDLPFEDAVLRLCTRYGYKVQWENTQGIDKNISVLFKKESFVKMLDNLCYISRKQYHITNRQVTIY
ncbi:FecR family protein [Chitinophaga sp. 30R24]|uniref:FecR family protein n=1 Tax=Chitinophaga sp. 30R24 TaxID=3248838 RepID=UPI003B8F11D4